MERAKEIELPGWAVFLITVAVIIATILAGMYFLMVLRFSGVLLSFGESEIESLEDIGVLGDAIGGLFNPGFALLAFSAVAFSTFLQRKELRAQLESIRQYADAESRNARTTFTIELLKIVKFERQKLESYGISYSEGGGLSGSQAVPAHFRECVGFVETVDRFAQSAVDEKIDRDLISNFDEDAVQFALDLALVLEYEGFWDEELERFQAKYDAFFNWFEAKKD